jgi:hypothetical protein
MKRRRDPSLYRKCIGLENGRQVGPEHGDQSAGKGKNEDPQQHGRGPTEMSVSGECVQVTKLRKGQHTYNRLPNKCIRSRTISVIKISYVAIRRIRLVMQLSLFRHSAARPRAFNGNCSRCHTSTSASASASIKASS